MRFIRLNNASVDGNPNHQVLAKGVEKRGNEIT